MLSFLGKRATPIQASCKLIFLFSFFSFFLSPPGCANTRDREYLCRRGRTRDGFVEGSGISLSLSFCWKVYSSPIESFTYIENFAAMYSYIQCIYNSDTILDRSTFARYFPPSLLFHSRECSLLRRFNRIATENFYTIPSVVFAEESDGTRKTDLSRLEKNFEKDETNSNAN